MAQQAPTMRPGYYVGTEWFNGRYHQALARARHLSAQYGRPVGVVYRAPEDSGKAATPYVVTTVGTLAPPTV